MKQAGKAGFQVRLIHARSLRLQGSRPRAKMMLKVFAIHIKRRSHGGNGSF